jgi:hypothetical protein
MLTEVTRIFPYQGRVDRPFVLWTGTIEEHDRAAFRAHGIELKSIDSKETFFRFLSHSRALVADIRNGGLEWIRTDLRSSVRDLYYHGLLIVVRTRTREEDDLVATKLAGLSTRKLKDDTVFSWIESRASGNVSVSDVALQVSKWQAGPAIDDQGDKPSVEYHTPETSQQITETEHLILLRRAFADCSRISLKALTGGNSGKVFRVDAVFADHAARTTTLPFVIKFDKRAKVKREFENYWTLAHPFVPFNQRALVDADRSCLGFDCGLLVATFVSGSESLLQSALRGHAHAAFHSLYESALSGWCAHSSEAKGNPIEDLRRQFPIRPSSENNQLISLLEEGVVKHEAGYLLERLRALEDIKYRVGTVHGDLHGRNVQSKGNDVVLLDFYSASATQPVAFDPAYLEVTTAFSNEAHNEIGNAWEETIDDLYQLSSLTTPPLPDIRHRSSNWLRNLIRQIRVFALANVFGPTEYARVLAYVLLRHATFMPANDLHSAERRRAYVVAERLILEIK